MTSPPAELSASTDAPRDTFFERERERLIGEISQGVESLLSTSNALNRKMEESISVGKEFQPIAGLWGRFVEIMAASGLHNPYEEKEEEALPPGVAPGGGIVYGATE